MPVDLIPWFNLSFIIPFSWNQVFWGCGAIGSVSAWLAEGYGFEPRHLHLRVLALPLVPFVQVLETGDAFLKVLLVEAVCWRWDRWLSSGG